ncbi:MAG: hypothetical protein HKO59_04270 [Phycisphaerales bacterium]|nr:hypothetical protein [Phycisphaerae bacterium]NNF42127.1 hypothetical protein [Phycisphaerales bacterium]NNM25192.1 hypothetical protein [Phycisphaerales bacterium]
MTIKTLLLSPIALALLTPLASAQTATFTWLDQSFSANDMTPDGRIVVGDSASGGYIWSQEDGYTFIGGMGAVAVSDDGSVVLGAVEDPKTGAQAAGIWTADAGWQSLGGLGDPCGSLSSPYELSADGAVAVGLGWIGCNAHAVRSTPEAELEGLEHLAQGNNRASVVSADGTLIGGFAQGSFSRTPAIWHADGTGELLDPPNGDVVGEVHAISDDGLTVLGEWNGDAFYRTEEEGVVTFPTLFASWTGVPCDLADDGTIVGFDIQLTSRRAWIKHPGEDAIMLSNYLTLLGTEGHPSLLEVAQAISTNGRVIIGHNAFSMGWIIHITPDPDLDGDGTVGFGDLLTLLASWGPCTGACVADLDGDGIVGFTDLLTLLAAWGT